MTAKAKTKRGHRAALIERASRLHIKAPRLLDNETLEREILQREEDNRPKDADGSALFRNRILDRIYDGSLDTFLGDISAALDERDTELGRRKYSSGLLVRPVGKTRTRPEQ